MINLKNHDKVELLLFDLDGTLLRSDKTISAAVLAVLRDCRRQGLPIGICTARGEQNSLVFLRELQPDFLIVSGGALIKAGGQCIYEAAFSAEETRQMIQAAREICGAECQITVDTAAAHYWNYKVDPASFEKNWSGSVYTDFSDFRQDALKLCVEIFEAEQAEKLKKALPETDSIRFSDSFWYKFTKKDVTKETAILKLCAASGILPDNIIAFGDDLADIGMLRLAGVGVAMGNALTEVKQAADIVIGSNDEDGIADYLRELIGES